MGLESYLFRITLQQPVPENDIPELFTRIGMSYLSDKSEQRTTESFGVYYFALDTDKGLTEVHCLLSPEQDELTSFSMRFSIHSPQTVTEQTFDLLKKLHDLAPVSVFDNELHTHLYLEMLMNGTINANFRQLQGTEEERFLRETATIEIDAEQFRQNRSGVGKRNPFMRKE